MGSGPRSSRRGGACGARRGPAGGADPALAAGCKLRGEGPCSGGVLPGRGRVRALGPLRPPSLAGLGSPVLLPLRADPGARLREPVALGRRERREPAEPPPPAPPRPAPFDTHSPANMAAGRGRAGCVRAPAGPRPSAQPGPRPRRLRLPLAPPPSLLAPPKPRPSGPERGAPPHPKTSPPTEVRAGEEPQVREVEPEGGAAGLEVQLPHPQRGTQSRLARVPVPTPPLTSCETVGNPQTSPASRTFEVAASG
ncbi:proline-rich protein 2-like [Phacochoerus africanus]|uniref:proline-rich protein 2-like n=1 Tax=Phacochoerus africanus TaxID=41426 RepID=UPI001FD8DDA4|nr:proline-rich protein 2-like [Phacochoerus africanus]